MKTINDEKVKAKSYKRKVFQSCFAESECGDNICNDDKDVDDESYNKCNICEEFGNNKEVWYRCTVCGMWSHALGGILEKGIFVIYV
ncbi:hypothetical protein JTB14_000305 [Gonioctena quinquepunctata]|nr:hypothetical protein JTB14_000305 [Gonioctena quinquepunctata]